MANLMENPLFLREVATSQTDRGMSDKSKKTTIKGLKSFIFRLLEHNDFGTRTFLHSMENEQWSY